MAWVTPPTFTDGAVLTAAQQNILARDLDETAPGKATTAGRWFISTGLNSVAERPIATASVDTSETTTSTTYANLPTAGPTVTAVTGTRAIVILTAQLETNTTNAAAFVSYEVSGASTIAASDANALIQESAATYDLRASAVNIEEGLTAGSNVFTCKYRVASGTGTFVRRDLIVMAL